MKKKILILTHSDKHKPVRIALFNEFKHHGISYELRGRECIETEHASYYFFSLHSCRNMVTFASKHKQMDIVYSSTTHTERLLHEDEREAFCLHIGVPWSEIVTTSENLPLVVAATHPSISSVTVYELISRTNYHIKKMLFSQYKEKRRMYPRRYFRTEFEVREHIRSLALSKIEEYNRLIQQEMKTIEKFSDSLS